MDTDQKLLEGELTHAIIGSCFEEYIPDLIVEDRVVVDTKVIERIADLERGQMLNYLRITQRRVGLIVNFRKPKLEWERIIV